jgi:hypothetical protein
MHQLQIWLRLLRLARVVLFHLRGLFSPLESEYQPNQQLICVSALCEKTTCSAALSPASQFRLMKTLKTLTLFAALVLGIMAQAGAGLYNITFDDGHGDVGSGQIDVEMANNYYYAVSGFLTVAGGKAIGDWNLFTAPENASYPKYLTSPAGAYWYNNAVYPTGNPQYPLANPLLDDYGLLFTQANGNELNLWGNADATYTLAGNINGWQNFNVIISFGQTTIAPVPEPVNVALGVFAGVFLIVIFAGSQPVRDRLHRWRVAVVQWIDAV